VRIIEAPEVVEPAVGSVVLDSAGLAWQRIKGDDGYRSIWAPAKATVNLLIVGNGSWSTFAMLLIECGPLRLIHDAGSEPVEVDARPSLADRLDRLPTS
jgi:hypothetical protein